MRHVIFARPVAARPHRMMEPAATARLVAPPGLALRPPAGFPGTAVRAVHLAPIAMAADEHLHTAAQAQEEPGRRPVVALGTTDRPWTRPGPGAIMPLHSCARTVSGTAPILNRQVLRRRLACLSSCAGSYRARRLAIIIADRQVIFVRRIAQVGPQVPPAPYATLRANGAPLRGRGLPVDYLDNLGPRSDRDARHRAAKKVRILTGVHKKAAALGFVPANMWLTDHP